MATNDKPLGGFRFWLLVWGLGLAGQLCWNMENQWFYTFIYAKIAKDSNIVTAMVICGAIVATFSTFFFGTLSDRHGSRRGFVSLGYIVWGAFMIVFGLTEYAATDTARGLALVSVLVVVVRSTMTFFGSMSNDANFNAWTNDMTTDRNRGQIGASLATQPVIGTIVGTVVGGLLIGAHDDYQRLFWTMGSIVIVMGLISLVFFRDAPTLTPHKEGGFWHQFASVFDFKTLFARRELLLACVTAMVFCIAFNVFFAQMGNWVIYRLGFTPNLMGLVQGLGLILAMLLAIPGAILINHRLTPWVALTGAVLAGLGLLVVSLQVRPGTVDPTRVFAAANTSLLVAVFLIGAGNILITQSMYMWIKQLYPAEARGQFEGIRIISFVLIPMLVGTTIGNIIIRHGAGSVLDANGMVQNIPTEAIFRWGGFILIPIVIPFYFAARRYFARVKAEAVHG